MKALPDYCQRCLRCGEVWRTPGIAITAAMMRRHDCKRFVSAD